VARVAGATDVYDDIWRTAYGDIQRHGPAHRHLRRLLGEVVAGLPYSSVVDVGCGAGDNVPLLASADRIRYVGADVSAEALQRARGRHPEHSFVELDVERGALDERFDLVFSCLVLEHLREDEAAVRHMHAMTGGHLVVATVAGDIERYRPWEEQVGHVRNYRDGELEALLERCGYEVVRVLRWGFPFYSPLTRLLQNHMTATPSYGRATRALTSVMHGVYRLNSRRRGDLVVAVARPRSSDSARSRSESSSEKRGA
jgi:SAM-dependent methyltransferase